MYNNELLFFLFERHNSIDHLAYVCRAGSGSWRGAGRERDNIWLPYSRGHVSEKPSAWLHGIEYPEFSAIQTLGFEFGVGFYI